MQRLARSLRRFTGAGTMAAAAAVVLAPPPAVAQKGSWIGTWMASQQSIWGSDFALLTKIPVTLDNQTIRQIVRISLGGQRFRVVISNEYGSEQLRIGEAHVALAGDGSAIVPGSDHKLTFGGQTQATVPPGAPLVSDPVDMPVEALEKLSLSIFLPERTPLTTFHWDGKETSFIGQGNLSDAGSFNAQQTTDARVFLSRIMIEAPGNNGTVVAIGDSITDGNGSSLNANSRWPDFLAERLASRKISVINAGIFGARLLRDKMGANAPARFARDVLAQPNVGTVVLLLGTNDISWPGSVFAPDLPLPQIEDLVAGYRQLINQAHAHNIRIIGRTLPPFEGALSGTPLEGYYTKDKEELRQRVNAWMRSAGEFDAVIDFDALLRDPDHPTRLLAEFDSGDHLHPGNKAMAEAVDRMFKP
jgi:lysophospholipase L1-like esterase